MDFVISRYQQLIKENLKEVAKLITTEQGKTLADAEGDVMRGLQENTKMAPERFMKHEYCRWWRTCAPTPR